MGRKTATNRAEIEFHARVGLFSFPKRIVSFDGRRTIHSFMRMKLLVSIGFAAHVLLGNVCMMQMANAQEIPTSHEEHMAMESMSSADCPNCPEKEESHDTKSKKGSPCSGGHCISQAVPQSSIAIQTSSLLAAFALPVSALIPSAPSEIQGSPHSTAPPGVALSTDTIVLRC